MRSNEEEEHVDTRRRPPEDGRRSSIGFQTLLANRRRRPTAASRRPPSLPSFRIGNERDCLRFFFARSLGTNYRRQLATATEGEKWGIKDAGMTIAPGGDRSEARDSSRRRDPSGPRENELVLFVGVKKIFLRCVKINSAKGKRSRNISRNENRNSFSCRRIQI